MKFQCSLCGDSYKVDKVYATEKGSHNVCEKCIESLYNKLLLRKKYR